MRKGEYVCCRADALGGVAISILVFASTAARVLAIAVQARTKRDVSLTTLARADELAPNGNQYCSCHEIMRFVAKQAAILANIGAG
jgi:hypothetical protein